MFRNFFKKVIILTFIFSIFACRINADYSEEQIAHMYSEAMIQKKTMFSDTDSVPWAVEPITGLAKRGIVSGMGDGTFAPSRTVSRAEFIKMITSVCGIVNKSAESDYSDVSKSHWAYVYVSSAYESGLTDIYSSALLNANVSISREDICYMSVKALESAKIKIATKPETVVFSDEAEMSSYAKDAIYTLSALGVINGRGDGVFSPKDSATRAESAKIVYNVLKLIEENY